MNSAQPVSKHIKLSFEKQNMWIQKLPRVDNQGLNISCPIYVGKSESCLRKTIVTNNASPNQRPLLTGTVPTVDHPHQSYSYRNYTLV